MFIVCMPFMLFTLFMVNYFEIGLVVAAGHTLL